MDRKKDGKEKRRGGETKRDRGEREREVDGSARVDLENDH